MSVANVNFIFCPPPLGKPDPNKPKPEQGPDLRTRVFQKGALLGLTCGYNAANLLRERWKAPNTDGRVEREFERAVSLLRKALSKHSESLPGAVHELDHPEIKNWLVSLTHQSLRNSKTIQHIYQVEQSAAADDPTYNPFSQVIPEFLQQQYCPNMHEYMLFLQVVRCQALWESLFATMGEDPKELYTRLGRLDATIPMMNGKWEDLQWFKKNAFLSFLGWDLVYKRYGFKISSWGPQQPFASLVQELKMHGPLIVQGIFGKSYYLVPPRKLNEFVMNRELHGWLKSDPTLEAEGIAHSIVLVGAKKIRAREYVYYIDPGDPSDPDHPETQLIYCMSYERLIRPDSIYDRCGILRKDAPHEIGYATYYPSTAPVNDDEKGVE